jgi:hypothetical protein
MEALNQEMDRYRRLHSLPPNQLQAELDKADQFFKGLSMQSLLGQAQSSPEGGAKLQRDMQDAMAVHQAASPMGSATLDLLASLTPTQWQQLTEDGNLAFSTNPGVGELPLPSQIQERMREAKPSLPLPKTFLASIAPEAGDALEKAEEKMQADWAAAPGFRVTVQLNLNLASQPVGMLRVSPEPAGGQDAIGPLASLGGLTISASPQQLSEIAPEPDREARLAADPILGKQATFNLPPPQKGGSIAGIPVSLPGYSIGDVLPAVEAAYGVRLVGGAYLRQTVARASPPTGDAIPAYKVLDSLAGRDHSWELDGSAVRLRSRTWAHDRRADIPERFLQRWTAVRERKGVLGLDDMADIALALRDEQVESLVFGMIGAVGGGFSDFLSVSMGRDILRVYGRLQPLQREALRKGRAIALRALMPDEQRLLVHLNRQQNRSMFSLATGTKPLRTPDQLAAAALTLELKTGEGEAPPPNAAAAPAAAFSMRGVAMFRITFPDGQKDEYMVPLPAPKAPASPRPSP